MKALEEEKGRKLGELEAKDGRQGEAGVASSFGYCPLLLLPCDDIELGMQMAGAIQDGDLLHVGWKEWRGRF